ncbi:MAG: response regulator [Holophagaceae bacterium]|jgi:CheY-like chemotaxis protein|uniref:Response regulator n=1 Tax=Candidatus Geothrix odensensis TaxID=2954440 RepID=A0A936F1K1_9BACT|nr:response regulator [Candidatus Geothrix odensensis]
MPRLLLVDDNPSIHRIAESLLAPTDVELTCVDSAAEALDRLEQGERFDVALVDTAMPGMDGWTLLTRLRAMDATAQMPIALMAGVLDPVDPAKLAKAPIQGFLKKPIELRELGDRVKALLATPVVVAPSPFSTVPATPASELVKRAEAALPELRPEPEAPGVAAMDDLFLPEPDDDLLVLTAEDLWPEEAEPVLPEPVLAATVPPNVQLELEELDLDSLQDLTSEALPPAFDAGPEPAFPAFDLEPALPEEEDLVTLSGLEELEAVPADVHPTIPPPEPEPEPVPEAVADDLFADLPDAASLIGEVVPTPSANLEAPAPEALEPAPVSSVPVLPVPVEAVPPAAGGQVPAAPGQVGLGAAAPASPEQAQALLQALLADPVLVDALVKAVVARMGDQVLREIAWEVMPDLAGRLQR